MDREFVAGLFFPENLCIWPKGGVNGFQSS